MQAGLLDETGRILTPEEAPEGAEKYLQEVEGEIAVYVDENVYLTQRDIRHIQTAKAAMAAGVLALAKSAGVGLKDIKTVFIAGGFGNFMDAESAARIGLIDKQFADKIQFIGNAAGSGAIMALLNDGYKGESEKIAKMGSHVELGGDAYFMEKICGLYVFLKVLRKAVFDSLKASKKSPVQRYGAFYLAEYSGSNTNIFIYADLVLFDAF